MYRVLMGNSEGRGSLGKALNIWEDNVRTDMEDRTGGCWRIHLAQDTAQWAVVTNTAMNLQVS